MQAFGRPAEVQFFGDRDERTQLLQLHLSTSHYCQYCI